MCNYSATRQTLPSSAAATSRPTSCAPRRGSSPLCRLSPHRMSRSCHRNSPTWSWSPPTRSSRRELLGVDTRRQQRHHQQAHRTPQTVRFGCRYDMPHSCIALSIIISPSYSLFMPCYCLISRLITASSPTASLPQPATRRTAAPCRHARDDATSPHCPLFQSDDAYSPFSFAKVIKTRQTAKLPNKI